MDDIASAPTADRQVSSEGGTGTPVDSYPGLPYPGRRPGHGYVQADERVLELVRRSDRSWGLAHCAGTVDSWLAARGAPALPARSPLLCYGSNACPSKLQDLRVRHGLTGPVVMTPCTVLGLAAAWCAGERLVDRSVPATLVAARGSEDHFLWWVAAEQWPALDHCEGRGERYDLVRLPARRVRDDLGAEVPDVRAYVGLAQQRRPMLDVRGRPLLLRRLDQHGARAALQTGAEARQPSATEGVASALTSEHPAVRGGSSPTTPGPTTGGRVRVLASRASPRP